MDQSSTGQDPRLPRPAPRSGDVGRRQPGKAGCGTGRCGCSRDLGPLDEDEGPSEQDIERFGDVTRTCPECGAEVYDEAEICHACGHAFSAASSRTMPPWAMVAVVLVIGAMLAMVFL